MHYVIIRDDDTNAFTPVACLEKLYRPFLDQGLPVNLATIPAVSTSATMANGQREGFLAVSNGAGSPSHQEAAGLQPLRSPGTPTALSEPENTPALSHHMPIASNQDLVQYLKGNPGFHIVQHGCHHDYHEFDRPSAAEIAKRLEYGSCLLQEAGLGRPRTFVAPYDKLSRPGLCEVAARFRILSTGWYELRRLPYSWWPRYGLKKLRKAPHWRVGQTLLLSHPGCLLSYHHTLSTMMGGIFHYLENQRVTVLVTHWWEYFRNNEPDEPFIDFLHETASYLATRPNLKVITFDDLLEKGVELN